MFADGMSSLFQELANLKEANPSIDIAEASGLSPDVIGVIENLEADHSKITMDQIARYVHVLGCRLDFETAGMGKIGVQSPTITIRIVPISTNLVPLGAQSAPT